MKKSNRVDKPQAVSMTQDEYEEGVYQADMMSEEEAFSNEVKGLTKAQLIQLLSDARHEAAVFSGWLMSRNRTVAEIKAQIRRKQEHAIKSRADGRREQSAKQGKVSEAVNALGVNDYFKFMQDVVRQLDLSNCHADQSIKTETEKVRAIAIDLLIKEGRSALDHSLKEWQALAKKYIRSPNIRTAREQLKKI